MMKKMATKPVHPFYLGMPSPLQKAIVRHPSLSPMAALHLAAVTIQRIWRGKIIRMHRKDLLKYRAEQLNIKKKPKVVGTVQKLRSKFLASKIHNMYKEEDEAYKNFCASKIAATFRMGLTKRLFKFHRFSMYHISALEIQAAWKRYVSLHPKMSKEDMSAYKIQMAWRSYANTRIFRYYKELINFKLKGDPSILLKSINPLEAKLFDVASNIHVRFRLGGERFPPLIYYKIYTHGPVCDVGSFAPRNYAKIKREVRKDQINITQVNEIRPLTEEQLEAEINEAGWYVRQENNGWRPISEKILRAYDPVEFATANRPKVFHFNKFVRKKLTEQQKRKQKLRWLRQMYKDAKKTEAPIPKHPKLEEEKKATPFDDPEWENLDNEIFDKEINTLIEWCDSLDYDKYVENWQSLATSNCWLLYYFKLNYHHREVLEILKKFMQQKMHNTKGFQTRYKNLIESSYSEKLR